MSEKRITPLLEIKALGKDMQRVVYLMKILDASCQWLYENAYATKKVKKAIEGVQNRMQILLTEIKVEDISEHWQIKEEDYNSERIQDLAVLLDFMGGVSNVGDVTQVLKDIFKEQQKSKQNEKAQ